MPVYCYRTKDGALVERVFRMGRALKRIRFDGRMAYRSLADESKFFSVVSGDSRAPSKTWPMTCVASGVNASQAGELRDYLAKAGVPTEVTPDGDPVYRSASHRRKALKARGMVDKSSYV